MKFTCSQGHNLQVQPCEVTHSGIAAINRHLWAVYLDWDWDFCLPSPCGRCWLGVSRA
jgi:hypothetical protein